MTAQTADARAQAEAHVVALLRRALAQRLWLLALFLLLFRKRVVDAELASREPAQQGRTKSPFVYDMR
jgi:hypothetical protein